MMSLFAILLLAAAGIWFAIRILSRTMACRLTSGKDSGCRTRGAKADFVRRFPRAVVKAFKSGFRRELALSKAAGTNLPWHFLVHLKQGLQSRMFARRLTFADADGESVTPRHVSVRSLVLFADKAFSPSPAPEHDFESGYLTKGEFLRFLHDAWSRGYVLVRVRDLFAGRVRLPGGKTPLVLSVDDVSCCDRTSGRGFAERMEVSGDNGLCYLVRAEDGRPCRIPDGDVPGVLDMFVREHPDFSHDGARAIIGLAGGEGVLGCRDERDAAPVVRTLRRMGYEFACLGRGRHHGIRSSVLPGGAWGAADVERLLGGVGRVVGDTDILISPFGADIRCMPMLLRRLKKRGFRIFLSTGEATAVLKVGGCFFAARLNLGGAFLRARADAYRRLFGDPQSLYDRRRTIPLAPPRDNLSLVAFARRCLAMRTAYVWGGTGEVLTHDFLDGKEADYPDFQSHEKWQALHLLVDGTTRGFDCSGLITRFLMGGFDHFLFRPELDMNARGLLQNATRRGPVDSLPEIPGTCLHMDGHTGIYVGNGQVIESTPNVRFGNGVVQTRLSDRAWNQWYFCRGIDYPRKAKQ